MSIREYKRKVNDKECNVRHLLNIIRPYHSKLFPVYNKLIRCNIWMRVIKTICKFYKSAIPTVSYYSYMYGTPNYNRCKPRTACTDPKNIADYYLSKMDISDVYKFMSAVERATYDNYVQMVPWYTGTGKFLLDDTLCQIKESQFIHNNIESYSIISYRYGISLKDIYNYLKCHGTNRETERVIPIKLSIKRNEYLLELFPDKEEYIKFIAVLRGIFRFDTDDKYHLRAMNICTIEAYKSVFIRILQVLFVDGIMINKNATVLNKQRNNYIKGLKTSEHYVIIHDLKHNDTVKKIPRIQHETFMFHLYMKHIFIGLNEINHRHKLKYLRSVGGLVRTQRCELVPNIKTDNSIYSIKNPMQTPTDVQIREMATIIMLDMMTISHDTICDTLDKYIIRND